MKQYRTLSELNIELRDVLKDIYEEPVWLVAEVAELNQNRNGHCYLELIEKCEQGNSVIARCRATIWAHSFRIIRSYFESVTRQQLTAGIKILINVTVEFHEVYGLSLNIKDIDPVYTLGDLAQKRQQIIDQLKSDGIFEMNQELVFPDVPKRIAIISSPTAAGYGDFVDQLENNAYGFKFQHKLYAAQMQGENAAGSIISALELVYVHEEVYDVVVIIRGGGAQADLFCFDNYELAANITQFPLPVVTGIGHDRDETIVDLVANRACKTPTAVATLLVDCFLERAAEIGATNERLKDLCEGLFRNENSLLKEQAARLQLRTNQLLNHQRANLIEKRLLLKQSAEGMIGRKRLVVEQHQKSAKDTLKLLLEEKEQLEVLRKRTEETIFGAMSKERERLKMLEHTCRLLDPKNILKRGYSLTYLDGVLVKSTNDLKKDDVIVTHLGDGTIESTIN